MTEPRSPVTSPAGISARSVPRPAPPEFNVDWQLSAVSPEVRRRTAAHRPSTGSGWSRVPDHDLVRPGRQTRPGLHRPAQGPGRADHAGRAGQGQAGPAGTVDEPPSVRPDPKMFDSLGFNPHGELVVEFDDRQVGPEFLGRVAVALSRAQADTAAVGGRVDGHSGRHEAAGLGGLPPVEGPSTRRTRQAPGRELPAGSVDCAKAKCVALTYDDGPGARDRPAAGHLAAHTRQGDLLLPRLQRLRPSRAAAADTRRGTPGRRTTPGPTATSPRCPPPRSPTSSSVRRTRITQSSARSPR